MDYSVLGWVSGELDITLGQAGDALEEFAESGDTTRLQFCVTHLHQAGGILRMLELEGAALLADELEALAQAMLEQGTQDGNDASETLMRGILRLRRYLEQIQRGGAETSTLLLLPLINELRAARSEAPFARSAMFGPEFSRVDGRVMTIRDESDQRAEVAPRARAAFQRGLLGLLRGDWNEAALVRMTDALKQMDTASPNERSAALWWVGVALLEALYGGALDGADAEIRPLIARLEREMKRVEDVGAAAEAPVELLRPMLYHLADVPSSVSECVASVQAVYGLHETQPQVGDTQSGGDFSDGPDAAALSTVAAVLREDVAIIKDRLDLHVRTDEDSDPTRLPKAATAMRRVGDTLAVLGLESARRTLRDHADQLAGESVDEATVMRAAESLLYVESELDRYARGATAEPEEAERSVFDSEVEAVHERVIDEAIAEMARIREDIIRALELPGTPPNPQIARRFNAVTGALRALDMDDVAVLFYRATRATDLVMGAERDVDETELDDLADAITSLEYYLEAVRDGRHEAKRILEVARGVLDRLVPEGDVDWEIPVSEPDEHPDPSDSVIETSMLAPVADESNIPGEPEMASAAPDSEASVQPSGGDFSRKRGRVDVDVPVRADEVDDEILEIFLEEVEEVLETLGTCFPQWRADVDDQDALLTTRRMFHTLKGSGRLAGALLLGELSWSIENLLNRVLDGSREPAASIYELVGEAIELVPELAKSLTNADDGGELVEAARDLMRRAIVEADPDAAPLPAEPTAGDIESSDDRIVPVSSAHESDEHGVSGSAALAGIDTAPALDPTLYEIFRNETEEHLANVEGVLSESGKPTDPARPSEGLVRTLHTLTGSARMAGVDAVAELGRALENLARVRLADSELLDAGDKDLIDRGASTIRALLTALGEAGAAMPDTTALVSEAKARGKLRPGPSLEELSDRARIEPAAYAVARAETHGTAMPTLSVPDSGRATGFAPARTERRGAAMPVTGEVDESVPDAAAISMADGASAADATSGDTRDIPPLEQATAPVEADSVELPAPEHKVPEPFPDEPDADLAEIFIEEAHDILAFLEGTLGRWEEATEPDAEVAELHRSLHTLKGGARLAGFQGIGHLCHALESLVAEVSAERLAADDRFFDLTRSVLDELADLIERAAQGEQAYADPALLARLRTHGPGDESATEEAPDDRQLREVFLEESADILAESERLIDEWREQPDSTEYSGSLQRVLHTLKGGARMTGLVSIADLAHGVETLVRDSIGGIDEGLFALLEACNDRLIQQRETVTAGAAPESAADLLTAIAERPTPPAHASPVVAPDTEETPERIERSAPAADAGARGDVVRVSAELVDNLVNHAGEVSIYRARLEQQAGAVDFNLAELNQTVTRLGEQLRTLEIETEAQILYGFGRDDVHTVSNRETFDPLELDRFSRMQELSRALSESVNDLSSIQSTLETLNRENETLLLQQSRVNADLQDGLMRTRMVPFANLVPRMRRVVRQAAQELGNQAKLQVGGAEGEMDRTVLDRVVPPLEHMLRNALAHGIESPAVRSAAGKPDVGTIRIDVSREGADVVVRVADDGAGMDLNAIRSRAVDRGLIEPDASLTEREITQFILEPGFSTASQVTQIAGRGVGMDVVNAEIKQLGGGLEIDSTPGEGTRFTVRLPFTLALNQALLCQAGDEAYAIPLSSIEGVVRAEHGFLQRALYAAEPTYYEYAGSSYELMSLAGILGAGKPQVPDDRALAPLILVHAGEHRVALQVDGLIGSRDIVVKSPGPQISGIPGIFGATILADGRVVLILDVGALMRHRRQTSAPEAEASDQRRREHPLVMVVDDSITMRKVATRLLERNGMEVVTAKDGVDAVTRLQERMPDAVLLDIEMPRMDGYEFAAHMRNEPALREVPIVMVTSRTGEKHRQRAMDIGVDRYLGKPYQEGELLESLQELLEAGRAPA